MRIDLRYLVGNVESMSVWLLPEDEVIKRKKMIAHLVENISSLNEGNELYFKNEKTKQFVEVGCLLAHFKLVSNEMLIEYLDGLLQFLYFMAWKKFSDGKNSLNLVRPPIYVLLSFLCSDEWRTYLIGKEVTGQEFQIVNGITIPYTLEQINLHLDRICKIAVTAEDIAYVKADFRKYNEKLYENKISNDDATLNVHRNGQKTKYVCDIEVLLKIHNVSVAENILNCQIFDFLFAAGNADFSQITFTNATRGKYLIYKMKRIMGEPWYSESVRSKNWTKSDCNRYGNINETTSWANKIYQVIEKNTKPR